MPEPLHCPAERRLPLSAIRAAPRPRLPAGVPNKVTEGVSEGLGIARPVTSAPPDSLIDDGWCNINRRRSKPPLRSRTSRCSLGCSALAAARELRRLMIAAILDPLHSVRLISQQSSDDLGGSTRRLRAPPAKAWDRAKKPPIGAQATAKLQPTLSRDQSGIQT